MRVARSGGRGIGWLLALVPLAGACATPVAISTSSSRVIHRYLTQSALTAEEPSTFSLIELRRYDLLDLFHDDPDPTIEEMRRILLEHSATSACSAPVGRSTGIASPSFGAH
jgi:hypothetical protein